MPKRLDLDVYIMISTDAKNEAISVTSNEIYIRQLPYRWQRALGIVRQLDRLILGFVTAQITKSNVPMEQSLKS